MMMMMMLHSHHNHPTLHIPSFDNDGPFSFDDIEMEMDNELYDDDVLMSDDTDHFRMYEFKIRRCSRGRSHDWTDCPFAHPGEKARRRDPRKVLYSGNPCPEFRKGCCSKGDTCELSHGVFECWLHPCRYRTQPCKDGVHCRRRICFFAHTPDQLRVLPQSQLGPAQAESYDGSPSRFMASPTSPLYASSHSPTGLGLGLKELTSSVRSMQIGGSVARGMSGLRPGFTRVSLSGQWEEPAMERVESGRDVRAKIYAKLSRENSLAQ